MLRIPKKPIPGIQRVFAGQAIASSTEFRCRAESEREIGCSHPTRLSNVELQKPTLFSESWWLNAAGGDNLEIVSVGNCDVTAQIPIFRTRKLSLLAVTPPPFTRICEPLIISRTQNAARRHEQTASILGDGLEQFARLQRIEFVLRPGSALGISFAALGFKIEAVNTFVTESPANCDVIWESMHPKLRSCIRAASKVYQVDEHADIKRFMQMSTEEYGRRDRNDHEALARLWSMVISKKCGVVTSAVDESGVDGAVAAQVWDQGALYFLLSARSPHQRANGANALLIWNAMKLAQKKGLQFDIDGYHSIGALRFLRRFGLQPVARMRVSRSGLGWKAAELARDIYKAVWLEKGERMNRLG